MQKNTGCCKSAGLTQQSPAWMHWLGDKRYSLFSADQGLYLSKSATYMPYGTMWHNNIFADPHKILLLRTIFIIESFYLKIIRLYVRKDLTAKLTILKICYPKCKYGWQVISAIILDYLRIITEENTGNEIGMERRGRGKTGTGMKL